MTQLHIFKPGTHTAQCGTTYNFTEADLAATVAAYNPTLHEAPLVIGHPQHDAPAAGWVKSLSATAHGLIAEPQQIDASFAEQIAKGSYKKISASFYHPTAANNPVPGVYYLRHVGFLGAQPPAVKGLRPIELAESEPGVIQFSEDGSQATDLTTAALEAENHRLKAELAQRDNAARLAAQQTTHATSVAYAEQLVAAGMKPLHAPVVIAALDAAQSGTVPLAFGEGDQRQPLSVGLKTLFNDLTNPISFTEVATKTRTGLTDAAPTNPLLADAAARAQR
ncbi:Mu-like prophage I protein [Pseudomonas sp. NFACC15-1]|uniref:phage protease n=1 Tax=unclassified Pseudomonas TaxID=196821 RepID=UPI000882363A|nr:MULTISPECIES: phage protease [unclassified Pseudomonas]SDA63455.1 Mu-like prophage I protein [Pseudomonas sp. NFACC15-1]SDX91983.1 Mu-like prophage I protein [Pseudomonas sp. NFACC14]